MIWLTWSVGGAACGLLSRRLAGARELAVLDLLTAIAGAVIGGATATSVGARAAPAMLAAIATALLTLLFERAIARSLRCRRATPPTTPMTRIR